MKKRIFLLLTVIGMMVMSSCTASETSKSMFELYTQASEALNKADSLEMNVTADMSMNYAGETMDIQMDGLIKQMIKSETDIDMQMEMTMEFMGMPMTTSAYYKDGVYYIDAMGERSKVDMSLDEALEQISSQPLNFTEAAIKNESLQEVGDTKELSFTLDSATMNDELINQMGSLVDDLGADANFSFGDVELKVVLDKSNNFKSFSMIFSMNMTIEGEAVTYDMEMNMDIVKVGGVTIDFPTDLDTY